MPISINSRQTITELINSGSDNMTNLFYAEFVDDFTSSDSHLANAVKVRISNFTPPTFSQGTYSVNYMTVDSVFPSAVVNGTKSLSFSFRMDKSYEIYKYLLSQKAKTTVTNLGFATNEVPEPSEGGLTINIYGYNHPVTDESDLDPSNIEAFTLMYTFRYCWIQSITLSNYSYSGSNPVTATVTIGFMDYDDPQNLLS